MGLRLSPRVARRALDWILVDRVLVDRVLVGFVLVGSVLGWAVGCANPYATPSCGDGVDNDGDGLTDLTDPDCASETSDGESRGGRDAGGDGGSDAGRPDGGADAGRWDAGPDAGDAGPLDAGPPDAGSGCSLGPAPDHVCAASREPRDCGGTCVDVQNDPAHCGGCGRSCAAGEQCVYGQCSICAALGGDGLCEGRCAASDLDRHACGGCGATACGPTEACVAASCGAAAAGQICAVPYVLAEGTMERVDLFDGTPFDVARPRCIGPNAPVARAAIVELTASRAGSVSLSVRGGPADRIVVQMLDGAGCACAALDVALCLSGDRAISVVAPAQLGTAVRALVGVTGPTTDQLRVTFDVL